MRTLPLSRAVPRGVSWLYDVQRIQGTRSLGVVFDVGANVGQTVREILAYDPAARIWSFEPVLTSYRQLVAQYGERATCVHAALGATQGTFEIPLRQNSETNTLLVETSNSAPDLTGEWERVTVQTIDGVAQASGLERIDVLKMDVQGYESEVIAGASELLARDAIRFVYTEVNFDRDHPDMSYFPDLHERLLANRFLLSGFYEPNRWGHGKSMLGFANALYVHHSIAWPTTPATRPGGQS